MERIICDVCSMDYPATEAQCPICGCARSGVRQTSAGNTPSQEDGDYTPVKGGRFSKSNVRKRLKAAQIQPVPVEIPTRAEKVQEPEQEPEDNYDEEEEELDEDDGNVSNRALIVIVALLLAAIVAVSSYIVLGVFGFNPFTGCAGCAGCASCDSGSDPTASTPAGTTAPVLPPEDRIPCTALTVVDGNITLVEKGGTMTLSYSVEPIDTTDTVSFVSANPAVATVDAQGRVTAVGSGETTITITCGDFTKTCVVTCVLGDEQPDDPQDPVEPDEPMPPFEIRKTDVSFNAKGYRWRAFKETDDFGDEQAAKFTWKMDDESIATVVDGYVTVLAPGRTTLRVYYGSEEIASCIIRCNWEETQQPETPDDPQDPEDPDTPATPAGEYFLKINNTTHPFKYSGENTADVTINLNSNVKSFKLTIVNENGAIMDDVVWTMSKEGICSISGNTVKGLAEGTCRITAEYKGISFLVFVRCNG